MAAQARLIKKRLGREWWCAQWRTPAGSLAKGGNAYRRWPNCLTCPRDRQNDRSGQQQHWHEFGPHDAQIEHRDIDIRTVIVAV